ncbi:MAG TPA: NifU family protein [Brumimicrobium sp.]|nr:NifU family protein [Brumimicrobium sp.]
MARDVKELEEIVLEALSQLRPFLEQDGGDMELMEITEDKIVKVKLLGNCKGCSMSIMTMKVGLEEAIKKVAPEIQGVEAIDEL